MEEYGYVSGDTPGFWGRFAPYIKSKTFTFVILAALAVATPLTAYYLQNNTFDTRQRASGTPQYACCGDSDRHMWSGGQQISAQCQGAYVGRDQCGCSGDMTPYCYSCSSANEPGCFNTGASGGGGGGNGGGGTPQEGDSCDPTVEQCRDVNGMKCWRFNQALPPASQAVWYTTANISCNATEVNRIRVCGSGGSQVIDYCQGTSGTWSTSPASVATPTQAPPFCAIGFYKNDTNLNPYLENVQVGQQIEVRLNLGRIVQSGESARFTWGDGSTDNGTAIDSENYRSQHTFSSAGTFTVSGVLLRNGSTYCQGGTGNYQQSVTVISASQPTATPRPPTPTTPVGGGGCTDYECSENVSGGVAGRYYSCRGVGPSASCFEGRNCSSGRSVTSPNTYCTATSTQPTPTGTIGGANPTATPTPQTAGPSTPTPTGGLVGTNPTATPTPGGSGGTTLALELILQGIGLPTNLIDGEAQPNTNPASNVRTKPVTVEITTAQSTTPITKTDSLIYDPTSKKFKANIDIGTISNNFSVQIRMPGYAKQLVGQRSGAVILQPAASVAINETILAADINSDGFITGDDYEKAGSPTTLKACFNKSPSTSNCQYADINADGKIDLIDYKFLIDNIIKRK